MSTKYFNFNNEADLTPIEVNDETGVVEFTLDGQVATFESIQEFAEFYALARNVVPENLKNWTLTEDGNHVAFVLRAGTAGLEAEDIANIANGLRAAGMSPEEIGRAIASAQTAETRETQLAKHEETTSDIVERVVSELITNPINELALVSLYSADNLMRDIAQDTSLFTEVESDYDEFDESDDFDEFDEFDESDDFDDFDDFDEAPEYTLEDTFRHNLSTRIKEKIAELSDVYPNVPALTALRIDTGIDDDEASRNDLHRAQIVASLASRSVAVYVITITGDHNVHVHDGFVNDEDVVQLLAQDGTKVSKDSSRFYIYNV
jgi:hypothetical protein